MPWLPKAIALATLAYAASPIDLVPDFIPIVGYLDDLLVVPLGIAVTLRLTPAALLEQCRAQAQALAGRRLPLKGRWLVAGLIVLSWLALGTWLWRQWQPSFFT